MAGLVPSADLGAANVIAELDNGLLNVRFVPSEPGDVVSLAPWAQVVIGAGEKVVMGSAVWYNGESSSIYPLRPVAEAWQEIRAAGGCTSGTSPNTLARLVRMGWLGAR
ncbi:MAG: hypothetical protein AB1445_10345 [Bacillota bacterium]